MNHKKIYFGNLDALRTIAFLLVFWQHSFGHYSKDLNNLGFNQTLANKFFYTGGAGVYIFFVLSGFLITYLLFEERKKNRKINLLYFYARRTLRIWPLYYLICFAGIFVFPAFIDSVSFIGDKILNLSFLNNFDPKVSKSAITGIAWSVAIEEQFYLLWPIIFIFFKGRYLNIIALLIFIGSSFYVFNAQDYFKQYYHTFSNIRFLMIGCLGAILYHNKKSQIKNLINNKKITLFRLISLTVFIFIISPFATPASSFLELIILPLLYLLIIIYLCEKKSIKNNKLSKLGKYTYGMYFYHPTIILIFKIIFYKLDLQYQNHFWIHLLMIILSLIITVIIAIFSYKYFESYFLKLKNKLTMI